MMHLLSFIKWDVSPTIFTIPFPVIGDLEIRWYGLLFALSFVAGQYIMSAIFKTEGRKAEDVEKLLVSMVIYTIVGARLGHCLFYEPEYYLSHPWKILYIREGGLASHGATIAILIGMYLFVRKHKEYTWLYLLDRIVIGVALAGAFIRLGNLMNSEIVGLQTNVPWGFIFSKNLTAEGLPEDFARHPSQLYEAIFCLFLFGFLLFLYTKTKAETPAGRLLGWFVVLLFIQRILVEFTKENQVAFENGLPLNMGQILSIPLIFGGAFILYRSYTNPLKI